MFLDIDLPSPISLKSKFPLHCKECAFLENSRATARKIASGKSSKLALVVGPCSIHNIESALIYAEKLKKLSDYVEETLFIVMRVYVEKPRTTVGWKGFLYDPYLNGTNDLAEGLFQTRALFYELAKLQLPAATEFVNPLTAPFFQDLVTWGFIGARTTTSQIHRELASSLQFPVGFKNTLEGDLTSPINSIISAKTPHTFLGSNNEGKLSIASSTGNPYCHLVLRGSEFEPNYDKENLAYAKKLQKASGIHHPIMIDCSHGNSGKNPFHQKEVFKKAIQQYTKDATPLLGLMFESFLESGNQSLELGSPLSPTLSITDPCLGWNETEALILHCHETLLQEQLSLT
jgi:3-deoxy-7-phosphoheptulonate synthase